MNTDLLLSKKSCLTPFLLKKNADIVERFVAKRDMTPTCLTFGEVRLKHVIAVA
jgi:hypothetical protein